MVKSIVINGAGGSGKDTFIDEFIKVTVEEAQGTPVPVFRYSAIDQVKEYALQLGWDGKKDARGRKFLSDLKAALISYNDSPFIYMMNRLLEVSGANPEAFVFYHVREPEEIDKMVKAFNSITILVERNTAVPSSFNNRSDREVYDYSYTYYVSNNGTVSELRESARAIYHDLMQQGVLQCPP